MIFIFSFGKLSLTNTVLTPLAPIRVPPTSSWNASMSTIMKLPVVNMSLALFWSIWSQEPWTPSDQVPSAKSSVPITLFLDSQELVTTGLKAITQKVLNLLILFLMLFAKNQNPAIVFKDFSWPTPWVVALDPVWELFSFPKFARNIQTGLWTHTLSFHRQRYVELRIWIYLIAGHNNF